MRLLLALLPLALFSYSIAVSDIFGSQRGGINEKIEENQLEEYVIILDKMKHSDVIKYYDMIDISIYPRKKCDICNLISSTKLLESMSMEKAIILSNLDPNNEIINQDTGLFNEPNNTEDLLNQIKVLLDNEGLGYKLGQSAREWVQKNREWKQVCQKNIQLYNSLVN